MSKLLKSKFLLGVMVVAVMAVAVVVSNGTQAAADTCSTGTTTLRVGSRGAAVTCLQATLDAGIAADGVFGPKTQARVMGWQSDNGLVADGVFGPKSRAVLEAGVVVGNFPAGCTSTVGYSATTGLPCGAVATNLPAGCTSTVGFSPTTGAACNGTIATNLPAGCTSAVGFSPTTGASCSSSVVSATGEGSLAVTLESSPSNGTEIAYSTTKAVMALKLKATGSDMSVNRVDFNFGSRAWLFVEKAGLYDGANLVAEKTLSASSFDEITPSTDYRLRFDGLNFVVAKDSTKILTLKLTAPAIISSPNTNVVITFNGNGLRATDSTGLITYEPSTALATRTFQVKAITAGVLTATLDSTSPQVSTVITSATDTVLDTTLLVSGLKATGDTVHVTTIPYVVTVTSSGTADGVDDVVEALHLYKDGVLLGSGSYAAGCSTALNCTITFSSLNEYITKDTTAKYTIKADLKKIDGTIVTAGDTVQVTMTHASIVAEDSDYTAVVPGGSSIGLTQHMFVKAPIITLISAPTPTVTTAGSGTTQTGTFVINFSVKAMGSDIYVDSTLVKETAGTTVTQMSYDSLAGTPVPVLSSTADTATAGYKVVEGETKNFTLTAVIVAGNAFTNLSLTGLGFATTNVANGTTAMNWGLTDFKTPNVYLAN